jgi:hypothetical protein
VISKIYLRRASNWDINLKVMIETYNSRGVPQVRKGRPVIV